MCAVLSTMNTNTLKKVESISNFPIQPMGAIPDWAAAPGADPHCGFKSQPEDFKNRNTSSKATFNLPEITPSFVGSTTARHATLLSFFVSLHGSLFTVNHPSFVRLSRYSVHTRQLQILPITLDLLALHNVPYGLLPGRQCAPGFPRTCLSRFLRLRG